MPTTPFHSDDANDANCISCITTPQKSPPTPPQKTFPRRTLLPQHVPSLRVPFAGHPPRPPNSLRSPNTTPLAPSTKAGFRNKSSAPPLLESRLESQVVRRTVLCRSLGGLILRMKFLRGYICSHLQCKRLKHAANCSSHVVSEAAPQRHGPSRPLDLGPPPWEVPH